jgi:hypothetical protein
MGTTPGGCLQTQDHPELKISALCLAQGAPVKTDVFDDVWFTYFFNESNHKAGIPTPDFVTYHFCEAAPHACVLLLLLLLLLLVLHRCCCCWCWCCCCCYCLHTSCMLLPVPRR